MKNTVYLCGPINGCTDEEATNWRESFKESYKFSTLDPMKRDYRGSEMELYREIVELDKMDIRNSDIVLVNYVKPSVGTSMEVFYAHTLGIPVVTWWDGTSKLSPWLIYHTTSFVTNKEEALEKCYTIMGHQ